MQTWCLKICEESLVLQLSLNFKKKKKKKAWPEDTSTSSPFCRLCWSLWNQANSPLEHNPQRVVSVASSYCSCHGLGSALFCFLLYWVWWSECPPHRLDIRTLSPQLVASFGDIVESFKVGAILEEVCHWEWGLRVISLASLPVHSLLGAHGWDVAMDVLLLLVCLPLAVMPPCHDGLVSFWNYKPR